MISSLVWVSWLVFVLQVAFAATDDNCHIELHPPRVVVKDGDPVSVNCTTSIDIISMYWDDHINCAAKLHASREAVTHGVNCTTSIDTLLRCREDTQDNNCITLRVMITDYNANFSCYVIPKGKPECKKDLSLTVYQPPDNVSVSSMNSTDSMVEGSQYQLKCEIQNIAPVQNLTVRWYKGGTLVHEDRDYVIEDGKSDREKAPVSVSSTLLITPSRADDGAEYSCGAELDLGPEGPQPPLTVKSTPLRVTVHSTADGCVELHPPRVVVRHGDPVSVNCTVSIDHSGMGWAAPVDDIPNTRDVKFLTWRVESLTIWDLSPLCFANRPGKPLCKERLSVTVYKPPDSVSFSSMNSADSMVEGSQYHLKCEIQNIAPVQNLTVKWYKGGTVVHEDRDYVIEDRKSEREKAPVSVASTVLITANRTTNRTGDKIQYICEAELDLGPEGPQPPLAVKSTPLRVTVHYKPTINPIVTELHVIRGKSAVLDCSAEGNPPPDIVWMLKGQRLPTQDGIYTISETDHEGNYTCRANNYVGIHEKTVQVIFTDPTQTWSLTVVVTLAVVAVLLFICCIYFWKRNRIRARKLAELQT